VVDGNVNTSKYEALSLSLKDAFSGNILPGGEAIIQPGSASSSETAAPQPPIPTIVPVTAGSASDAQRSDAPAKEVEDLERLKREIDEWTEMHGLSREVKTTVERRGLVVQVLTDKVLFESGSADVKPGSQELLDALARLLKTQVRNPIQVEGNTDNVPRDRPVPDQLGALDRSGHRHRPCTHRAGREPGPSGRHRLRRPAPHRDERDGAWPADQPEG
jgi:chemotaxis protein MotB